MLFVLMMVAIDFFPQFQLQTSNCVHLECLLQQEQKVNSVNLTVSSAFYRSGNAMHIQWIQWSLAFVQLDVCFIPQAHEHVLKGKFP